MKGATTIFRTVLRGGATLLLGAWTALQGYDIAGTVTDRVTGRAIRGAKVTVNEVGTNKLAGSATTDATGRYRLSVPETGNYTLVVAMDGYGDLKEPAVIALTKAAPEHLANVSMTREGPFKERARTNPDAMSWETGARKSYLIPALEIPTFLFLLNQYDRHASPNLMEDGKRVYATNLSTTWDHLVHGPWVVDKDAFAMNQFNHPYTGTVYHGFARSAGLGYWDALLYDQMGSLLWETGGETTKPSYNDQITTGFGGSFFGEALFRMANLMLEGDGRDPGFWHKLGATMLSPAMGLNRFAFGDRFKAVFPSNNPSLRWRVQLGSSISSNYVQNGVPTQDHRKESTAEFSLDYGLPGKAGYTYDRPFDYFDFEVRTLGNRSNPVDSIMIRGLLYGTDYELGDSYQGIWGLYGGYDYLSPYIFRVSSTSASVGTTFQWQFAKKLALQGSLLGGFGYAAAGSVTQVGDRDYHFGVAPQGLGALRFIMGNRAMLDMTGRRYYLTGTGGNDPGGREAIDRLNVGLTLRVYERHALGIQYIASSRNAHYPDRPDSRQTVGTWALVYNLLGYAGFGAIK
jgi:hypothetical protein